MKRFIFTFIGCCLLSLIAAAQSFQQSSDANKQAYIKAKAEQVGATIAQRPVALSPAYLALVSARVEAYAKRIGVKTQGVPGKEELGLVLARGTNHAATFAKVFQARNVPALIGIYLPMMESEFRNELVSGAGSAGMFQFMPQTAVRFGITAEERTDPAKSADAAARYLSDLQTKFAGDVWLSLLSYNVGEKTVEKLLTIAPEARGAACSICVLTEKKETLGQSFPKEGQHYTPALIAAAIIGENPQDFGLMGQPLSAASAK
jgi:Transglycosylase SLT domain